MNDTQTLAGYFRIFKKLHMNFHSQIFLCIITQFSFSTKLKFSICSDQSPTSKWNGKRKLTRIGCLFTSKKNGMESPYFGKRHVLSLNIGSKGKCCCLFFFAYSTQLIGESIFMLNENCKIVLYMLVAQTGLADRLWGAYNKKKIVAWHIFSIVQCYFDFFPMYLPCFWLYMEHIHVCMDLSQYIHHFYECWVFMSALKEWSVCSQLPCGIPRALIFIREILSIYDGWRSKWTAWCIHSRELLFFGYKKRAFSKLSLLVTSMRIFGKLSS